MIAIVAAAASGCRMWKEAERPDFVTGIGLVTTLASFTSAFDTYTLASEWLRTLPTGGHRDVYQAVRRVLPVHVVTACRPPTCLRDGSAVAARLWQTGMRDTQIKGVEGEELEPEDLADKWRERRARHTKALHTFCRMELTEWGSAAKMKAKPLLKALLRKETKSRGAVFGVRPSSARSPTCPFG
jgi:hypothetical protein